MRKGSLVVAGVLFAFTLVPAAKALELPKAVRYSNVQGYPTAYTTVKPGRADEAEKIIYGLRMNTCDGLPTNPFDAISTAAASFGIPSVLPDLLKAENNTNFKAGDGPKYVDGPFSNTISVPKGQYTRLIKGGLLWHDLAGLYWEFLSP